MSSKQIGIILIFIVCIILGMIIVSYYFQRQADEFINSDTPITKMEIDYYSYPESPRKIVTLNDSFLLRKISSAFKQNKIIKPDREQIHTEFINAIIYKNDRQLSVQLSKTTYSGWIILVGDKRYANDSLANIFRTLKIRS